VLLADRGVARERHAADAAGALTVWRAPLIGLVVGRVLAERGRHVVIQSVTRTLGSEGRAHSLNGRMASRHYAGTARNRAIRIGSDRDDRRELSRIWAMGGGAGRSED
jgi:hypothetical protein